MDIPFSGRGFARLPTGMILHDLTLRVHAASPIHLELLITTLVDRSTVWYGDGDGKPPEHRLKFSQCRISEGVCLSEICDESDVSTPPPGFYLLVKDAPSQNESGEVTADIPCGLNYFVPSECGFRATTDQGIHISPMPDLPPGARIVLAARKAWVPFDPRVLSAKFTESWPVLTMQSVEDPTGCDMLFEQAVFSGVLITATAPEGIRGVVLESGGVSVAIDPSQIRRISGTDTYVVNLSDKPLPTDPDSNPIPTAYVNYWFDTTFRCFTALLTVVPAQAVRVCTLVPITLKRLHTLMAPSLQVD